MVNLAQVDLNLLVVLRAVLEERSATRAAARLHVTQPAVSNALARLRELFADPLVVRTARGFVPTARGEALAAPLAALLTGVEGLVAGPAAFDPKTTRRRFSIAAGDVFSLTELPHLAALFAKRLPHASLRVVSVEQLVESEGLARGEVDLLVGIPPTVPSECATEPAYEDRIVCVVRRDHPRAKRTLTLETYASLPHVELTFFGTSADRVDRALARAGLTRRVAVSVPHFAAAPLVVARTDCVATVPARVAHALAAVHPLRVFEVPVAVPALSIRQMWHARAQHDPAVHLLRALVREAARRPPFHKRVPPQQLGS